MNSSHSSPRQDTSRHPGVPVVPELPLAAPSDMRAPAPGAPDADRDPPWYRPTVADIVRHGGWRWLIVAASAIVMIPLALALMWFFQVQFAGWSFKLASLVVGIGITVAAWATRQAIAARRDAFCIHCGYSVEGLAAEGYCPECGRHFALALIREYQRDPAWFIERCRQMRTHPEAAPTVHVEPSARQGTASDGTA